MLDSSGEKKEKGALKLRRKLQQEVEANSALGEQRFFLSLSMVVIEGFN